MEELTSVICDAEDKECTLLQCALVCMYTRVCVCVCVCICASVEPKLLYSFRCWRYNFIKYFCSLVVLRWCVVNCVRVWARSVSCTESMSAADGLLASQAEFLWWWWYHKCTTVGSFNFCLLCTVRFWDFLVQHFRVSSSSSLSNTTVWHCYSVILVAIKRMHLK